MSSNKDPAHVNHRTMTLIAWASSILISAFPEIAWIAMAVSSPAMISFVKMGLISLLALVTLFWKSLRPLRNYFLVMFAFFGLSALRLQFDFSIPALQSLFGDNFIDDRMQAEQIGKLLVSLAMIGTLFVLGYRRREFFLTLGHLRAPIKPVPWLGFPKSDSR
jgi:hypothetical protein